jgi:biotin carboxyl carrier protein
MIPGKKMELNEGIRLLSGKGKIDIPLKKKKEEERKAVPEPTSSTTAPAAVGPMTSTCRVEENGRTRTFTVTIEPAQQPAKKMQESPTAAVAAEGTPVRSAFGGSVEVVDIMVKTGDKVGKGQVVAAVEAMKAKHDIKAPCAGTVQAINATIGDEIDSSTAIMTIA